MQLKWVGPWNDEAMKFHEAAKYYYYPGMHEPGSCISMWCKQIMVYKLIKIRSNAN